MNAIENNELIKRIRWQGQAAYCGKENAHTSSIGKSEKKRTLGKSRADTGGKY
jgi:hypothetical protein